MRTKNIEILGPEIKFLMKARQDIKIYLFLNLSIFYQLKIESNKLLMVSGKDLIHSGEE